MTTGADDQTTPPETEPSKFGSLAHSIGARNLIIIIIAMPLFFLVAVLGVIAVLGNPNEAAKSARPDETASAPANAAAMDAITYPAGAAPGAIALDGDRLAVRIDGPDGVTVVVYDLAKGEVIARVPISREETTATP